MIPIVFKNSDFLVAHKPAGISFHSETDIGFAAKLKSELNLEELFPVHRLDEMTSGLVIFALNRITAKAFGDLFEMRKIEKYYLAISDVKPSKKQGLVKGDMEKSRRKQWKLMRSMENPAVTQFFSFSFLPGKRLFLVKPFTGKTHQIRVALKSVGAAILGDDIYGGSEADRGYLHAYALRFKLVDQSYEFVLPPLQGQAFNQPEFMEKLKEIGDPWNLKWPKL